ILVAATALLACFCIWTVQRVAHNEAIAKQTGLPVIRVYVTPMNPLRLLFANSIIKLLKQLPVDVTGYTRFYANGWEATERYKAHEDFGPAFFLASPGGNYLYICDPDAVQDILQRKSDFQRDIVRMSILNVYGKNISTTEDAEWQIHRKATAAAFTEANNETVWKEALEQAREMREFWMETPKKAVTTISKDTRTFTLNVLAAALFSKRYPFKSFQAESGTRDLKDYTDPSMQYRDSLSRILRNIFLIFLFGTKRLREAWWMPKAWKQTGDAVEIFHSYISGLIAEERSNATPSSSTRKQDLVSNLVRACSTEKEDNERRAAGATVPPETHRRTLTEDEIISNLFVYAFAGNDTTAITLAHAVMHLAGSPETQLWIREEIQHYAPTVESLYDYKTFPKLKRCLSVMMETLRLCHPLGQLIKTTGKAPQTIHLQGQTITLPKGLNVNINLTALHTLPSTWGEEPLDWNPERFFASKTTYPEDSGFDAELLIPDTTKYYLPWAYGSKVCPGKKFSQVEFVAALAMLFQRHQVTVERKLGESQFYADFRAEKAAIEIEKKLLNEMKNSAEIGLVW
ncbi:cytochrome P450 monooxygenase-like protein, partial [Aaosphaeria arxii CBS 175.79]